MNRLKTFAGQQPVYLGDIDFVQNAAENAFTLLSRALVGAGNSTFSAILQGVELSMGTDDDNLHWTAGVVVLNGEVLPVEAGSVGGLYSDPAYFHVNEVDSGDRTFKDGVSRKCWATRMATISHDDTDGIAVSSVPRLRLTYSTDGSYAGTPETGAKITGGSLVKRGGVWFVEVLFDVVEAGQYLTLGDINFIGNASNPLAELEQKSFFVPMVVQVSRTVGGTTVQEYEVQPVMLTFGTVDEYGDLIMSVQPTNGALTIYGRPYLKTIIPQF